MDNGLYANYMGNVYQVSKSENSLVRLISRNEKDQEIGFKQKVYPQYYKDRDKLPIIYVKDVDISELVLFAIDIKAKYKGYIFSVGNTNNLDVFLGTTDASLATKLRFDRTDKFYYEKWVPRSEVEIIEEKKDINPEQI